MVENANLNNCQFAELDTPVKCDSCALSVHSKCTGLSATKVKCLSLKNRSLKFFCDGCDQGLKELPDEFIFNEINERNHCANNLLFYNIEECDSNKLDDRISFDLVCNW
ncbi:Uncharacterized protein FWK35_00004186 [Aphis craccivora]|uniref:Uncharacterized protein n=1 Tax=Aphis craccivora TaxID=307492 RepID=A0A6G0ZFV1_APHCR|nr:Uncharacterized protein FWK35_00004186 [Aphis craccivora]